MSSLGQWWFNVKLLLTRFTTIRMQMTPRGQWFTILDNLIDILLLSVSWPRQCANLMITITGISQPQMLMCLNPWLPLRFAPGPLRSNVVFGENGAMGRVIDSDLSLWSSGHNWDISEPRPGHELCHWAEEMDRGNQFMSYPCHDNSII